VNKQSIVNKSSDRMPEEIGQVTKDQIDALMQDGLTEDQAEQIWKMYEGSENSFLFVAKDAKELKGLEAWSSITGELQTKILDMWQQTHPVSDQKNLSRQQNMEDNSAEESQKADSPDDILEQSQPENSDTDEEGLEKKPKKAPTEQSEENEDDFVFENGHLVQK
jgi:hypothetical protein